MTDPWGLSGGGGGNGTWDPGNVSPLMPMVAPDTPCDGPMVTEMGLNVPSPLMPMIAPDTPFEGPMVNYLDAYGSPWMPMHSPDEPYEGPMVNYLDAGAIPHYTGELRYSDLDGPPTSFVDMLCCSNGDVGVPNAHDVANALPNRLAFGSLYSATGTARVTPGLE